MATTAILLLACSNDPATQANLVPLRLTVSIPSTRSSLEELSLTDLYVFDYVGDKCLQTIHQTSEEASFGVVQLMLTRGEHSIYFVASRGDNPVVYEDDHILTWDVPKDTFWGDIQIDATSSTASQSITLTRVSTRLKVTATDEIPLDAATLTVTPGTWYYGIDYTDGSAQEPMKSKARTLSIPSQYIGTTGHLSATYYGISDAAEWTTDIAIQSKDEDGKVIGSAAIHNAAFCRNVSTEYSGTLFGTDATYSIDIDAEWTASNSHVW